MPYLILVLKNQVQCFALHCHIYVCWTVTQYAVVIPLLCFNYDEMH